MKKQLPIKEIIKKKSAQNNSLDHNESDRLSDFGEGLIEYMSEMRDVYDYNDSFESPFNLKEDIKISRESNYLSWDNDEDIYFWVVWHYPQLIFSVPHEELTKDLCKLALETDFNCCAFIPFNMFSQSEWMELYSKYEKFDANVSVFEAIKNIVKENIQFKCYFKLYHIAADYVDQEICDLSIVDCHSSSKRDELDAVPEQYRKSLWYETLWRMSVREGCSWTSSSAQSSDIKNASKDKGLLFSFITEESSDIENASKVKELLLSIPEEYVSDSILLSFFKCHCDYIGIPKKYLERIDSIVSKLGEDNLKELVYYYDLKLSKIPVKYLTKDIVYKSVDSIGNSFDVDLRVVPSSLLDKEICQIAVRKKYAALSDVPKEFHDYDLYDEAVKVRGDALKDVPEDLKDLKLCSCAVKSDIKALDYVPDALKEQVLSQIEADKNKKTKLEKLKDAVKNVHW